MGAIDKVALFGLDCADPSLTFERWVDDLPNIKRLMDGGTYGALTSSIPPVTVPAWSCMAASKDPGELGIYGFQNRKDHSYHNKFIATSTAVGEPRIWDILGESGRRSIVVGVPGTYPIVRPVAGCMVTSFLTPDVEKSDYTWPVSLKTEIGKVAGGYAIDVRGFRTHDKQWLLDQIYEMTDQRFKVLRYLIKHKPWDLLWMVEIGLDRMHHGFWAFMDPGHRRYERGNPFESAIHDYLVYLDRLVGEMLELLDLDRTVVWVVSDHGAKSMVGGFCFNTWLMNEGYLHLTRLPRPGQRFNPDHVDWSRTVAWGEGGYYAGCFLNVRGREPQGVIPPGDYEQVRTEIKEKLEALTDHQGQPMGTKAYRPEDLYRRIERVPPDLIVLFGGLNWRSVGTLGHDSVYSFDHEAGSDDANHAQDGVYIVSHSSLNARGRVDGPTLYDVAPTILQQLGLPIPGDMRGRPIA